MGSVASLWRSHICSRGVEKESAVLGGTLGFFRQAAPVSKHRPEENSKVKHFLILNGRHHGTLVVARIYSKSSSLPFERPSRGKSGHFDAKVL
jgi:hypothetical protein